MSIRVTDEAVEVFVLPTSSAIRTTDESLEIFLAPTTAHVRITDESLEILYSINPPAVVPKGDNTLDIGIRIAL